MDGFPAVDALWSEICRGVILVGPCCAATCAGYSSWTAGTCPGSSGTARAPSQACRAPSFRSSRHQGCTERRRTGQGRGSFNPPGLPPGLPPILPTSGSCASRRVLPAEETCATRRCQAAAPLLLPCTPRDSFPAPLWTGGRSCPCAEQLLDGDSATGSHAEQRPHTTTPPPNGSPDF